MAPTVEEQPMDDSVVENKLEPMQVEEVEKVESPVESKVEDDEFEDLTKEEDGGVLKKILKKGEGYLKPGSGAEVECHYRGTLEDGTQFDSSYDRNKPFNFKLGEGQVIKGWDLGVKTMKKGEKALLKIRSDYGYGDNGSGASIPPKATLLFEIELLSWTDEKDLTKNKDKGILMKTVKKADGWDTANDGARVRIHFSVRLDAGSDADVDPETRPDLVLYDSRLDQGEDNPVEFTVGEEQVIAGLDEGVKKMKQGEIAELRIRSEYAYGPSGLDREAGVTPSAYLLPIGPSKVPPNANLVYRVELVGMEKEKDSWCLSTLEKILLAREKKEQGNAFFRAGRLSLAKKRYQKALSAIENIRDFANYNKSSLDYDNQDEDEEVEGEGEDGQPEKTKKQKKKMDVEAEDADEMQRKAKELEEETGRLKLELNNNLAAVGVKEKDWPAVKKNTEAAMGLSPKGTSPHPKALYRHALALTELDQWPEAQRELEQCLTLLNKQGEDQNSANQQEVKLVQQALTRVKKLQKKQESLDRALFKKMVGGVLGKPTPAV